MSFIDFYYLKALHADADFHWSKSIDGNEFKMNDVRLLRFEKGSDKFQFKTSYEQQEWKHVHNIQSPKRRTAQCKTVASVNLKSVYSKTLPLSVNKLNDSALIDGNLILRFYKTFFDSLH